MALSIIQSRTLPPGERVCPQYGGSDWIVEEGLLAGDFLTINDDGDVRWFGSHGARVIRSYSFLRAPLQAVFCLFNEPSQAGISGSPSGSEKAVKILSVAILVNEFELQIHYHSGEKFEIYLPVAVSFIASTPLGLLLQLSDNQHAKLIASTIASGDHLVNSSNHHLLIRSPRSAVEAVPRLDGWAGSDAHILSLHRDTICMLSTSSSELLIFKVAVPQSSQMSRTLGVMARSTSNLDAEMMDFSPVYRESGNGLDRSMFTHQTSNSMSSARSKLTHSTASSAGSSRAMRISPFERSNSATYDSETLQSKLGVRQGGRMVPIIASKSPRPSASPTNFSKRSSSPVKTSFLQDDDLVVEGMDNSIDNSASLGLQLVGSAKLADLGYPDGSFSKEQVFAQFSRQKFQDALVLHVYLPGHQHYLQYHLFSAADTADFSCFYSEKGSVAALSAGSLAVISFPFHDGSKKDSSRVPLAFVHQFGSSAASVFGSVYCGDVQLNVVDADDEWLEYKGESAGITSARILSVCSLSGSLPFMALRHENGSTRVVQLGREFSNAPHRQCIVKQAAMIEAIQYCCALDDAHPLWVLQTMWIIESHKEHTHPLKLLVLWFGMLFKVPYRALESYLAGITFMREVSLSLTEASYDKIVLQQIARCHEKGLDIAAVTLSALRVLRLDSFARQAAGRESLTAELSTLLQSLRDFSCFCIGHNHGDSSAWQQFQPQLPKVLIDPPLDHWLDQVLNQSGATTLHKEIENDLNSVSHKIDRVTPFLTISLLSHWARHVGHATGLQACDLVEAFIGSVLCVQNKAVADIATTEWDICFRLLPTPVQLICTLAFQQSTLFAKLTWPKTVLMWVGRSDMVANQSEQHCDLIASDAGSATADKELDGLKEVEANSILRFPEDDRVREACRMLRSSVPVYIKLERAPEDSETERRQKVQAKLLSLSKRSMACSVGRGMLTIGTVQPLMAEALPIPSLNLNGRLPPNNLSVAMEPAASVEYVMWPEFHNGAAAALRIGPLGNLSQEDHSRTSGMHRVTRNWILYNKTNALQSKITSDSGHAGFLFGLGLLGHLKVLSIPDICDYLTHGQETTTVAVLIGVAASKIGSSDSIFSKTLCLHLPSLLPPQHWDIEISPVIQCGALVGLGFLYCRSLHRLMVEFLLEELSRKPTSDRCENRESLALCAAWALGMVLLPSDVAGQPGSADTLRDIADLRIEERLFSMISGGERTTGTKLFAPADSSDVGTKSSRILEGEHINTDITAPAACIALALIFMKSKNNTVLKFIELPRTASALDNIRPDMLLYRALAESLIGWDSVEPTIGWLNQRIPTIVLEGMHQQSNGKRYVGPYGASRRSSALNPSTAYLLYLNIIAGYCLGFALIYAGTFHEGAKQVVLEKLVWLQSIRDGKGLTKLGFTMEKHHKVTLEMCIGSLSLSLACIMAGSGNVDCMRVIRELRWKTDEISYGTHMALSMAVGMLFLAGGKYSLKRDPLSIACLLIAILPRYPSRTTDQQFHLQALRHLFVLAAEPRVLHTIDVDTKQPVSVDLQLELVNGERIVARAPGLLPELATVKAVSVVDGSKYYPSSLSLHPAEDGGDADGKKNGLIRKNFRLQAVPHAHLLTPMYVKRMPSIGSSVSQHAGSGDLQKLLEMAFNGDGGGGLDQGIAQILTQSPGMMRIVTDALHS